MQNKIIALAIAAAFAAPVAMAETANVNVYGFIDAGLRSNTANGATLNTMGSGTFNPNRWGIKGSEDLGDGMKALFGIEGGFNSGTGAPATAGVLFDRNSTVGLSSGDHQIELGRQISVAFKTIGTYDPFGYKYFGLTQAPAASINVRYNNDVSYTGKFGDVKVMAEHAMGTAGDASGSTAAAGLGYASSSINVGGAYSKTKPTVGIVNGEVTYMTVGAGYKFDDGKVSVGYAKNTTAHATTNGENTYTFAGASYIISPKIGVTVAYYKNVVNAIGVTAEATTNLMIAGVTYNLSKRTNLYVEADKTTGTTAAGADVNSNGYSLGLATSF